jgi:phosphoenolpyruvate synthase/pyruvate phosphate dikinase/DNA-binding Xre family transcriptional regulator
MVKLKIANLAKTLGKNISQIAEETGLNRNSVTALYHNKVDGIKFETIERICTTYKVDLSDIMEFSGNKQIVGMDVQEISGVPFTNWAPTNPYIKGFDKKYIDTGEKYQIHIFMRGSRVFIYFDLAYYNDLADFIYKNYNSQERFTELYQVYSERAASIENLYNRFDKKALAKLSNKELMSYFNVLLVEQDKFWSIADFLNAFDFGLERNSTSAISKQYGLDSEDVVALTSPLDLIFTQERLLELLRIIKRHKLATEQKLDDFLAGNEKLDQYLKKWAYSKGNYSGYEVLDKEYFRQEALKYINNLSLLNSELQRLENFRNNRTKAINATLRRRKIKENPLWFFQRLLSWREHRKKINLMALFMMFNILEIVKEKTGVSDRLLKQLLPGELDNLLKGLVSLDVLEARLKKGFLIQVRDNDYKTFIAEEAQAIADDLNQQVSNAKVEPWAQNITSGQAASQGFARGVVCVFVDGKSVEKFIDGNIIVADVATPEMMPYVKKAAAIITRVGGIDSHAAIVARELEIPCIVGVEMATKLIHDGDLIEVRANHGSIRILERKNSY